MGSCVVSKIYLRILIEAFNLFLVFWLMKFHLIFESIGNRSPVPGHAGQRGNHGPAPC